MGISGRHEVDQAQHNNRHQTKNPAREPSLRCIRLHFTFNAAALADDVGGAIENIG